MIGRLHIADIDADVDRYLVLLAEAGTWLEVAPVIDPSAPEHLPDWSGALQTIRQQIRMGDIERGKLQ